MKKTLINPKRIVLFRFHGNPGIVKNRIKLLKRFNPTIEIYGIYGGYKKDFQKISKFLRNDMNHIYLLSGRSPKLKWLNGDLAVREWFKEIGKNIDFDIAHLIEWDLLLFDTLENIFGHIPKNALGLSALRSITDDPNWWWTTREPWKSFYHELIKRVKRKYGYNKKIMMALGAGTVYPRKFLLEYIETKIETTDYKGRSIPLCNDEIRLPLFGQILGYKLVYTGIYNFRIEKDVEHKYFNAMKEEIELKTILAELKKKNGRRVFHPYWKIFNVVDLNNILNKNL